MIVLGLKRMSQLPGSGPLLVIRSCKGRKGRKEH